MARGQQHASVGASLRRAGAVQANKLEARDVAWAAQTQSLAAMHPSQGGGAFASKHKHKR